jgi:hypothetical protein
MPAQSSPTSGLVDIPQLPRIVPRSFKPRLPAEKIRQAQIHDHDSQVSIRSSSTVGSWTRNSLLSEFTGMFAELGRVIRGIGRLIDNPLDNALGRLELRRVRRYLGQLTPEQWQSLPQVLDVEWYAKRIVECVRCVLTWLLFLI